MSLTNLLDGVNIAAIVCNQWGDTGKGKFVDYFADEWADVIARGTGGGNTGHTVVIGDKQYIFHYIPSGILHDSEGKVNVIGNGVLINPAVLLHELDVLQSRGMTYNGLRISTVAHLVTPDDLLVEAFREKARGKGAIGTTMRGVGPGYASKIARENVRISHLFVKDEFVKKYRQKLELNIGIIKKVFGASDDEIREIMKNPKFKENGGFVVDTPNLDDIVSEYMEYAGRIRDFVTNTQMLIHQYRRKGKKILLEGAQGLLLSIEHGTYPYVTSSDSSASGLASGVGIPPTAVDLVLGVVKMFYMTRVGGGNFPTEFIDEAVLKGSFPSDTELKVIGKTPKQWEAERYDRESTLEEIKKGDKESLSRYCRIEGGEYGATTGRPRRTGWLDLVALRYAIAINGPDVISTKTDVLDHLEKVRLCVAYEYNGPSTYFPDEQRQINPGDNITIFPTDPWILNHIVPVYGVEMDGWMQDTSSIRRYEDLPENKRKIFGKVEELTGAMVRVISVGPERSQTIVR